MNRTDWVLGVTGTFLSAVALVGFLYGLWHIYRQEHPR